MGINSCSLPENNSLQQQEQSSDLNTSLLLHQHFKIQTIQINMSQGYAKDQPKGFSNRIEKIAIVGVCYCAELGIEP